MNEKAKNWSTLCRRTNDPKLTWLQVELSAAGIVSRRVGESFHAPILLVQDKDIDAAWEILTPVDDIPDDDDQFLTGAYIDEELEG